jgi:GNAT superfamily N-acetyltransferase
MSGAPEDALESGREGSLRVRWMAPADGSAFAALSRECPDTGRIRAFARYHVDAYRALSALRPDTEGLVAEVALGPGKGELAGSAFVSFGRCRFEGQTRPYALFHTLMVHPRHRSRGLAGRLTGRCVEHARRRMGDLGVILANVQRSNEGSLKAIGKWLHRPGGVLTGYAVGPRRTPPSPRAGVRVRRAEPSDLGEIARRMNAFYEGYNLYPHQTASELEGWLGETPEGAPFRDYHVAVDEGGRLLAGLARIAQSRIRTLEVERLPALMSLANKVVRLVPKDGVLRQSTVERAWFSPGEAAAGSLLWETVRWESRGSGGTLIYFLDPRSPLRDMFRPPAWLPGTTASILIDAPPRPDRLLYPIL